MSRFLTRVLAVIGAGAIVAVSYGQAAKQSDHIYNASYQIKAYNLTADEEATFSIADGVASPFWYAWNADGVTLSKVTIDGVDDLAYGPVADGISDGNMTVKLAYGATGIYILFECQDDSWAGYVDWLDYANDACELFGDKQSAQDLYGPNMATLLPCLSGGADAGFAQQMNTDYFQLQIRFGGLEPVEQFSMNWWNPLKTDVATYGCFPGNSGDGVVLYNRTVTFAYAESQYGIKIDILPIEGSWRRQEWMIPWAQWGGPNNTAVTPRNVNEMLGMCFGYNDLDPGVQTSYTAMRWRGCDPYSNCKQDAVACATNNSYDAWGDIVFDQQLDVVSPPENWPSPVVSPIARIKSAGLKRAEFFTIDGKSITAGSVLPKSAVVLRRVILDNGTVMTTRVPMSAVR